MTQTDMTQATVNDPGCAERTADAMVPHMKILVIEDDLDAAAYMIKAFREAGISADHASDGESGLFMGSENSYDAMIVDRMLPRRDGLSVIAELRKRGVNTPVLILSALGQVDDRVGAGHHPGKLGLAACARDRKDLKPLALTQGHTQVPADESVGTGYQDLHLSPPARPDGRPPGHG